MLEGTWASCSDSHARERLRTINSLAEQAGFEPAEGY